MSAGFTIGNVFPWGRSFDEYRRMFALAPEDLNLRILGCADGPASFNAELTARGGRVVSCDPLYDFSRNEIASRIAATREVMVERARAESFRFVWREIESPEALARVRMAAMNRFMEDYERGRAQGRYDVASLPSLSYANGAFDLAVCSHFLFLYSDEFSLAFHVEAILELLRIAREARIFPVLDMRGERSRHLRPVIDALRARGMEVSIETVDYEFQIGGNLMLRAH